MTNRTGPTFVLYLLSVGIVVAVAGVASHNNVAMREDLSMWALAFLIVVPTSALISCLYLDEQIEGSKNQDLTKELTRFTRIAFLVGISHAAGFAAYTMEIYGFGIKYLPPFLIGFVLWRSVRIVARLTAPQPSEGYLRLFKEYGFSSLIFFFCAFLSVTIYFGFAFAFDDRSLRPERQGLKITHTAETKIDKGEGANGGSRETNDTTTRCEDIFRGRILYPEGEVWPEETGPTSSDAEGVPYVYRKNRSLLDQLIRWFEERQTLPCRFVVTLVGHASVKELRPETKIRYLNNYLISELRTRHAERMIIDRLIGRGFPVWRVSWLPIGSSSEPRYLADFEEFEKARESGDSEMSVEIIGKAIKDSSELEYLALRKTEMNPNSNPPRLLDYFYFSVLTITTTGYGDIVPMSDYAKFLVMFANFCEVFYGVIFFSVLVSVLVRKDSEQAKKASETSRLKGG